MKKMNIHVFFTLLFLLISPSAFSSSSTDLHNLEELQIKGKKNSDQLYQREVSPHRKRSLEDFLISIPGVDIQTGAGGEGTPILSKRGQKGQRLPLKLNGVLLNQTSSRLEIWDVLPLEMVEQISVGQGIDFATIPQSRKQKVILGAGSFNEKRLSAQLHQSNFSLLGHLSSQEDNYSFTNPRNSTLYDSGAPDKLQMHNNKKEKKSAQLHYQSPNKEITATYLFAKKTQGVPGVLGRFYQQVNLEKEIHYLTSHYEKKFEEVKLSFSPFVQQQKQSFHDPLGENNGIPFDYLRKATSLGFQTEWKQSFSPSFLWHARINSFQEQYQDANISNARNQYSIEISPQLLLGPFFVAKLDLKQKNVQARSHWFEYSPGLRFEYGEFKAEGKYSFEKRIPTLDELYLREGISTGNSELKNETNKSIELQLSLQKKYHFIQTTFFQQKTNDYIQYNMVGGYRYRPFNIAQVSSRGIELNHQSQLGQYFQWKTVATWQKFRDITPGNNNQKLIEYTPQLYGQIWLESTFSDWTSGLGYVFSVGRLSNRANTLDIPDKKIVNIFTSFSFHQDYKATFGVDNLFNTENFDYWGFPLASRKIWSTVEASF